MIIDIIACKDQRENVQVIDNEKYHMTMKWISCLQWTIKIFDSSQYDKIDENI